MSYLIFFIISTKLSIFLFSSNHFFASCDSIHESEKLIPSTSTEFGENPITVLEEIDLSVYSSSGKKVSKEILEQELHHLFEEAEASQMIGISRPTSTAEDDTNSDDELEGTSSDTKSRKRMKYTTIYSSQGEDMESTEAFPSSYYEMPKMFAEAFDSFLKNNILDLTLIEFEVKLFSSTSLYYSSLWRDRNKLNGKIMFLMALLEFWNNQNYEKNLSIKEVMSRYFLSVKTKYRSTIMGTYEGQLTEDFAMMNAFNTNLSELKCSNVKKSLVVIILLFEKNFELLSSSFLFYLLLCSIKQLKGLEFEQAFQLFKINKKKVVSKISRLGGDHVKKFLKAMKKHIPEMSDLKLKKHKKRKKNPLKMKEINIPNFGLRLCLSLLELYLIETTEFSMINLIFFFGSRLNSPAEVFLSFDIFNAIRSVRDNVPDLVTSLLFDQHIVTFVNRRIMLMHGIDISDLRARFNECILIKNNYSELSSLIHMTDFQKKALLKKALKRRGKKHGGKKP